MNAEVVISADAEDICKADKLILPGVGHFDTAMNQVMKPGIRERLDNFALHKKKPVLGICLGLQMMAKKSEEGPQQGLSWIDAEVTKLKVTDRHRYKVPHICWNEIKPSKDCPLIRNMVSGSLFYFLHSFYVRPADKDMIAATTEYETEFPSVINAGNLYGVQFHPEKSHQAGFRLLENFLNI